MRFGTSDPGRIIRPSVVGNNLKEKLMEPYITIQSQQSSASELHQMLAPALSEAADTRLEVKQFRAAETAVLVAVVGALGTGLGALITGILKVAAEKGRAAIVLQGRSGRRVEVPADSPPERIAEYVELAKTLDVGRIEVEV